MPLFGPLRSIVAIPKEAESKHGFKEIGWCLLESLSYIIPAAMVWVIQHKDWKLQLVAAIV